MEHFREERPALQALPSGVFNGAIRLERRVSHEGLVSVGGNYYSVPDVRVDARLTFDSASPTILRGRGKHSQCHSGGRLKIEEDG
ncbi:hypothetical protein A9R05_22970 [Burkholderia sp. KK1]|nr:hypothetical protein A9R05_22970 [Burkholderia sp. KK1]